VTSDLLVLPLRLAIVLSLSGVALWGLFSLLDNLRKPELLRSPKAIVVKGCDPIETEEARQMCPQLFCQKALLDARAVAARSSFVTTLDRGSAEHRLIGGVARLDGSAPTPYLCVLEHGRLVSARTVDAAELDAAASEAQGSEASP
jgi:hypothetical protein